MVWFSGRQIYENWHVVNHWQKNGRLKPQWNPHLSLGLKNWKAILAVEQLSASALTLEGLQLFHSDNSSFRSWWTPGHITRFERSHLSFKFQHFWVLHIQLLLLRQGHPRCKIYVACWEMQANLTVKLTMVPLHVWLGELTVGLWTSTVGINAEVENWYPSTSNI